VKVAAVDRFFLLCVFGPSAVSRTAKEREREGGREREVGKKAKLLGYIPLTEVWDYAGL